jgi:hypothetical protein
MKSECAETSLFAGPHVLERFCTSIRVGVEVVQRPGRSGGNGRCLDNVLSNGRGSIPQARSP